MPLLLLGALCVALCRLGARTFAGPTALRRGVAASRVARRGLLDSMDFKEVEKLMKDPEKMKEIQAMTEKMMSDPAKKKMFEEQQMKMQQAVQSLQNDPEMKDFFEDIQKNGFEALKKYDADPRILRKFSQATGGVPGMPSLDQMAAGASGPPGVPGVPAAPPPPSWKPGDEVFIQGLKAKPELNGKKAMVVPPTAEERATLEGTGRFIVRLLDTGDQFAIKPENMRTSAEVADAAMSGSLEDVSMYNPAIQAEAAKLRESGKLEDLQNDPELKPVFEDIRKNGMGALEKYWADDKLMAKISKAMAGGAAER